MNIFQQYGIKEVADVTFYSINRVGDEEFYTPVLYLDTLKVSTIEKKNQTAESYGGYGNQKLSSWNFSKNITLKLEDALFSPASMSLLWGGQLDAKFSKYTSAIVKINIANKYGKLNYSTKAYPSPKLTSEEWDVVYKACNDLKRTFIYQCYYNSTTGEETYIPVEFKTDASSNDKYIEENRTLLQKCYYDRNFTEIFNENLKFINNTLIPTIDAHWYHSIDQDNIAIPDSIAAQILTNMKELQDFGTIQTSIYDVDVIDRMEKCIVKDKEGFFISTVEQKRNLLKYYLNDKSSSYVIYYDPKTMLPLLNTNEDGEIIGWNEEDGDGVENPNIGFDYTDIVTQLNKGQWIVTLATFNENQQKAGASSKLNFIKAISRNMHDQELLWGYDKDGLIRVIKNSIYIDQFNFRDNVKIIHSSRDSKEKISDDFEPGQVFPEKTNKFKLRIGTPYLKWSRTVKTSGNNIGHTFVINSDTFPNQYRMVGETYIRNREGKDERYQFIVPRVQISTDTNITLQAEGDPTVFSMSVDVFTPPNDIMMELRQYNVIEDNLNGGTKVAPQEDKITVTQTIYNIEQMQPVENNEIY